MVDTIQINDDIRNMYDVFYDKTTFVFDEFVLKLQVFQNYPMLRLKNYLPVRFRDEHTG